ncbi:hypothetical protein BTJ68_14843 [Hortaea werneckii EXF-2000]|uniref:Uncharacterized protein n=1 Tax=Hortaea werneckii EXF-2000 TaxID=1157616 RepID=A0A1Z5SNR2_HORWE|nr:hypothetical protein BTJ68_14843 [Hortaea werneckii EXF-2000]
MQQVKTAGSSSNVNVTGFDLDQAGLGKYMRQAKGGGARGVRRASSLVMLAPEPSSTPSE